MGANVAGQKRKKLSWFLAALFVFALIMGPGPGMLLINQPRSFLGLPQLYAWGLLWYAVEVGIVTAAYLFVWSPASHDDATEAGQAPASGTVRKRG